MKASARFGFSVGLCIWLLGCTGGLFSGKLPSAGETLTPPPLANTRTPLPAATPVAAEESEVAPGTRENTRLVVWMPPEFDPNSGTAAGDLLKARLQAFEAENPHLQIEVRIKAVSGSASLLNTLTAASAAAPRALPDLIALSRADLETAALKGLLVPYDGLSQTLNDSDWFSFSRQLSSVGGSEFGLPFATDALLLVYRTSHLGGVPAGWNAILQQASPLAFPAADPQALVTLSFYLAQGGQVEDEQGRPMLSAQPLTEVLKVYNNGVRRGVFPYWLSDLETDAETWQAYRDQKSPMAITWASRYLAEAKGAPDLGVTPLPSVKAEGYTLATGWLWALSNPKSGHLAESARLAEFLVQSDFMAQWSEAANYLPARPTALAAWKNQEQQAVLSLVAMSSQAVPDVDVLAGVGPVLREATLEMVKSQGEPAKAAQAAVERLNTAP